jgi:hypothetical protein
MNSLEFYAAFSLAIEVGFETLFSLPWPASFFDAKPTRSRESAAAKRTQPG